MHVCVRRGARLCTMMASDSVAQRDHDLKKLAAYEQEMESHNRSCNETVNPLDQVGEEGKGGGKESDAPPASTEEAPTAQHSTAASRSPPKPVYHPGRHLRFNLINLIVWTIMGCVPAMGVMAPLSMLTIYAFFSILTYVFDMLSRRAFHSTEVHTLYNPPT